MAHGREGQDYNDLLKYDYTQISQSIQVCRLAQKKALEFSSALTVNQMLEWLKRVRVEGYDPTLDSRSTSQVDADLLEKCPIPFKMEN